MARPHYLAPILAGELFERIVKAGRFVEDEARYFFQQLISGVHHCHCSGVCHRDLKLVSHRESLGCTGMQNDLLPCWTEGLFDSHCNFVANHRLHQSVLQIATDQQPTTAVEMPAVTATTFRNLATVLTSKDTTPQREATGLRTARPMGTQLKSKAIQTATTGTRPSRQCPA